MKGKLLSTVCIDVLMLSYNSKQTVELTKESCHFIALQIVLPRHMQPTFQFVTTLECHIICNGESGC